MAQRSTIIIIVLIFALLFSLLYASSATANQNSNALYTILGTKKAEASIYRLIEPDSVCFTLDDDTITSKYAFLSTLTKEADSMASEPTRPQSYPNNRYDGFASGVYPSEIVPLLEEYRNEFTHSVEAINIRNYGDEIHTFDCNFTYKGNQYYLSVKFQSLTAVNDNAGFVPVDISKNETQVGIARFLTYYTFNNTAVWTNHLDSFVILTISTQIENDDIIITTQIPPGKSWDYRLWPDTSSAGETVYEYQVQESLSRKPIAEGEIIVRYYPKCMSQTAAKSLYSQSGIVMKFPAYLPDNYQYICGIHFYNTVVIQSYWNRTIEDPLEEKYGESKVWDFPSYAFHPEALDNGVIQVIAGKDADFMPYSDAEERYEQIKNQTYYLDQQVIEIVSEIDSQKYQAVAYRHNIHVEKDTYILEMFGKEKSEFYIFKGKLPLTQIVKMAESLI